MKPSKLLRNALKLIATPNQWMRGVDHAKRYVKPSGDGAAKYVDCYCARGAIQAARPDYEWDAYHMAREHLAKVIPSAAPARTITGFNDSAHSHDTIVRWFKRAIARAEKLEGKVMAKRKTGQNRGGR